MTDEIANRGHNGGHEIIHLYLSICLLSCVPPVGFFRHQAYILCMENAQSVMCNK